jgi:signal transduction histidine kinase/ActR/RegA family two-component response regulator
MKISTKGRLSAATVLAAIMLIAAIYWWANEEVAAADRQRRHISELSRSLSEVRLVTFEYILHRQARAESQGRKVMERLDQIIAQFSPSDSEQVRIVRDLQARSAAARQLFDELVAATNATTSGSAADETHRFEAQLSNRLLLLQQENLADAFRLIDMAGERIAAAQRRVVLVTMLGLGLVAAATVAISWLIDRKLLMPIASIVRATRQVAAGNWNYRLDIRSDDEIGEMVANFEAMTRSLRDSFDQVERSNRELAALNQEIESFSYSVSHDLRAPLRSMDGFSLALLEDYADKLDDTGRNYLSRIRAASQRMGRLIDELLGLARVTRTELNKERVDLAPMARELIQSLQQQHPERHVRGEIEDSLVVMADKTLVHIVMQNLIENAWKFTARAADACIRVGRTTRDGQPVCFVADNGVGFDMNYADRLFGAFQRLHHENEFPGTGIGLATVHRIIRRHGATIWAESAAGAGATFFSRMNTDDNTILLVEDNPDDADLTLRAFKRSHVMNPVVVARDGIEALDYLFNQGEMGERSGGQLPTLIVLDLKLPKLDGLGVLKAVRANERTRLLPVVILTSSKEEQDLIMGYSLGANSYVRKPVDFAEFLEAAKVLGIYWLMMNQTPPLRPGR